MPLILGWFINPLGPGMLNWTNDKKNIYNPYVKVSKTITHNTAHFNEYININHQCEQF